MEYLKAFDGTVLRKKEYEADNLVKSYRYLADGAVMQACDVNDEASCATVDSYISLPGGAMLTLTPGSSDQNAQEKYSLQNFHGDTALVATKDGTSMGSVHVYEPFGQQVTSSTFGTNGAPQNSSNESMGWAADPTRKQESLFSVPILQMGARVYLPTVGRFLQTDSVEGGNANQYVYPTDPVNVEDYSGEFAFVIAIPIFAPVVISWGSVAAAAAGAAIGAAIGYGVSQVIKNNRANGSSNSGGNSGRGNSNRSSGSSGGNTSTGGGSSFNSPSGWGNKPPGKRPTPKPKPKPRPDTSIKAPKKINLLKRIIKRDIQIHKPHHYWSNPKGISGKTWRYHLHVRNLKTNNIKQLPFGPHFLYKNGVRGPKGRIIW